MKLHSFQYVCGLTLLFSHILAVTLIATTYRFSELTDQIGSILIVIPITLIYVTSFIKFVVKDQGPARSAEHIHFLPATTMYIVIFVFCASLLYVVIQFSFFAKYGINDFKMWLGIVESAFGALIGLVFERLFGFTPGPSDKAPGTVAPLDKQT